MSFQPYNAFSPFGGGVVAQDAAAAYRAAVMADSPVAYWRLDESSGTVAADETGSYPGTYVGSPTLGSAGPITGKTATLFDGVNDTVTTGLSISGGAERTVECWVMPLAFGDRKFLSFFGTTSGSAFDFTFEDISGSHVFFRHQNGNIRFPSPSGLGSWLHFAAVVPSAGLTTNDVIVYLNGSAVIGTRNAGANYSLATATTPLQIAGVTALVSYGYYRIAEVAAYPTALSAARIAAHYAAAGY